jgi:site-specific DNA-cytosine methylase
MYTEKIGGIMMKVLELFAGTRSIGKAFEEAGHEVFSIEWDEQHENIDWYVDISTITAEEIIERMGSKPEIIWASPDCTSYSQ